MSVDVPRFHLAFPVTDLEATRQFYVGVLQCKTGRESEHWIDFDFWGHQVVAHLVHEDDHPKAARNPVDGELIPAFHFGPIVSWDEFDDLASRFEAAGVAFVVEPGIRFEGRRGEQKTLFVADPSGNHLEFKTFRDLDMLFAKDDLLYN